MAYLLLTLPAFFGFCLGCRRWLKIPLDLAPLVGSCLVMMGMFWFSLAEQLALGRTFLIVAGWLSLLGQLARRGDGPPVMGIRKNRDSSLFFAMGLVLTLLCSLSGRPSVVDDYSFWAIIGKSIVVHDALPGADTSIFPRHLTYTPGLALLQYFFHGFAAQQNLYVAYLAQNLLLLSVLQAATMGLDLARRLFLAASFLVLLVLLSGSVLQKLRVDHFLYSCGFVVVWLNLKRGLERPVLLTGLMVATSLYLVKEVGILVGCVLLLWFLVELIAEWKQDHRHIGGPLVCWGLAAAVLVVQKLAWDHHCTVLGFSSFHGGLTGETVIAAFDPFTNEVARKAVWLFLREIAIGAADGLKLPYIVWYLALFWIWRRVSPRLEKSVRRRYIRFFLVALPCYLFYVVMNYLLQFGVFGLGERTLDPPSLSRYLNIFFGVGILLIISTGVVYLPAAGSWLSRGVRGLAVIIVLVTSWPERPRAFEVEIAHLGEKMRPFLDGTSQVCITPGNSGDHYPGFRLLYLAFPNRFNVDPFPTVSGPAVAEQLKGCDFLLVYRPERESNQLLQPFARQTLDHGTFFRVVGADSTPGGPRLTKVF